MTAPAARRPGLLIVTAVFAAMLLAANLATPLYAVYARQFGFSTAVLALVFAGYALVLIPALLVFGQLSDQLGRRPVIAMVRPYAANNWLICGAGASRLVHTGRKRRIGDGCGSFGGSG